MDLLLLWQMQYRICKRSGGVNRQWHHVPTTYVSAAALLVSIHILFILYIVFFLKMLWIRLNVRYSLICFQKHSHYIQRISARIIKKIIKWFGKMAKSDTNITKARIGRNERSILHHCLSIYVLTSLLFALWFQWRKLARAQEEDAGSVGAIMQPLPTPLPGSIRVARCCSVYSVNQGTSPIVCRSVKWKGKLKQSEGSVFLLSYQLSFVVESVDEI